MKGQAVLVSLVLFLIVLLTMSCACREPVLIDAERPSDDTLTCAQLRASPEERDMLTAVPP